MDDERSERTCRRDERVLIARIAAAERWGRTIDRTPSRHDEDSVRSSIAEADPDGALSAQGRARRADQVVQAHMLRMSRAAARARRRAAR